MFHVWRCRKATWGPNIEHLHASPTLSRLTRDIVVATKVLQFVAVRLRCKRGKNGSSRLTLAKVMHQSNRLETLNTSVVLQNSVWITGRFKMVKTTNYDGLGAATHLSQDRFCYTNNQLLSTNFLMSVFDDFSLRRNAMKNSTRYFGCYRQKLP